MTARSVATAATPGAVDALRRILAGRPVGSLLTVDDLRDELEASCVEGNAIGAAFMNAVRAGWLQPVGFVISRRRTANGRAVRRYRRCSIDAPTAGQPPHLSPKRHDLLPDQRATS